ncbi:HAMP domain-containing histidine kinase [Sporolactobacillus shoreae]|uniref:histidine kinase n=2 Tax=Sporolactobacillus shoreae TaxID=1465501 RepID=A0A4Z0GQ50_9BACL|nr:HAMP domain-containing histidine kinase [Sporolactobacillus shoreae]
MMFRFRWTLTKRIWLSFALLIFLIGVIMSLVYPFMIKNALREDSYDTIEYVQSTLYQGKGNYGFGDSSMTEVNHQVAAKAVGNLFVDSNYHQAEGNLIKQAAIYKPMVHNMASQKAASKRYELEYQGATLYYVISKVYTNLGSGYFVSYMWDTYPNELMNKLWTRMIYIFIMVGILSLFIAFWLARYLKRPLDILGRRFEEISRLNWEKPFEWKGDEEFERLSSQFEKMRLNLIKYDHAQKVFLQQASHELKTPIMVVHSYAQSVKDHIYPKGDLDNSIDVIIHEAEQMEKRVKKLLYFTRYDSLNDQKLKYQLIRFGDLARLIRERLIAQRQDIAIHIEGEETILWGDREQLQTVFENLVENGLRYAQSKLWMFAEQKARKSVITITNDGNPIPEEEKEAMFEPFEKGTKGQFGLGLAIVRRIVRAHRGEIKAENRQNGVAFVVSLPSPPEEKLPSELVIKK